MTAASFRPHWHAELELAYVHGASGTRPSLRRHSGPLRVQKHLHAEGPDVCQHIIIHPPGGIAGGDQLSISAQAGTGSWVQLTTPGAAKWYRAAASAGQQITLGVAPGATLEWLPQESIFYSGAQARLQTRIELAEDARLFYWDILALGRPASGERFDEGFLHNALDIYRDGRLLWHERQHIQGGDGLLDSPIGLGGQPVMATLLASTEISATLLEECRQLARPDGLRADLTQLPGLLVARCLADEALQARAWLIRLWQLLRPRVLGREALPPRIWST
jgi:urease accessory protein